jgi:hypothetical protein
LKAHLPSEKFKEIELSFDRIIRVQFLNGAVGGIRRRNISSKVTIRVKTMHGKRLTHLVELSIFDRVETIIDKLRKLEQAEMLQYISYKLIYCMGKMNALDFKKTIWSLGLKNDSQLLLVGNRTFQWDLTLKGQDIYVSILSPDCLTSWHQTSLKSNGDRDTGATILSQLWRVIRSRLSTITGL